MIVQRKVCFDHAPFYVTDGMDSIIQIELPHNLCSTIQDPRYLPFGNGPEQHELVGNLHWRCRLFLQSLDLLKSCEHPDLPAYLVLSSPKQRNLAERLLQIPIFDRAHFGAKQVRHVQELLATAECLLKQLGTGQGYYEEQNNRPTTVKRFCERHVATAEEARGFEA